MNYQQRGVTLVETLMAVTILGIALALAVPSLQDIINKKRIKSAIETLYTDMKLIHSESIKRQSNLFVSFQSGANWCYGVDDSSECDCSTSNDCQIDGVEKVVRASDFNGITMSFTGFTSGVSNSYVQFEGVRGVASNSGTVTFSRAGFSATLSSNRLGLLETCSNDLVTYQSCP